MPIKWQRQLQMASDISGACYICFDKDTVENPYATNPRPCPCKGSIEIHKQCLEKVVESNRTCSICKTKYNTKYLPNKDGRELIVEPLSNGGRVEYTINENNQRH